MKRTSRAGADLAAPDEAFRQIMFADRIIVGLTRGRALGLCSALHLERSCLLTLLPNGASYAPFTSPLVLVMKCCGTSHRVTQNIHYHSTSTSSTLSHKYLLYLTLRHKYFLYLTL